MSEHLRERLARARQDEQSWEPVILRPSQPDDEAALLRLLDATAGVQVCDVIEEQIVDLIKTRHPAERLGEERLRGLARGHLGGLAPERYGVWVYYPWSRRLVHLLDRDEFVELRTNRNKYKLTPAEQAALATRRVGVVGLSVGQSVATTLALERSVGELRLADFDRLDLSNLNRIRSPVHNLGVPKVLMTAREVAEIDPFLEVRVFSSGVGADNLDEFLLGGGKLDLLIDECDSIDVKLGMRARARRLRIAVLMETSDRGLIDVERFDLEPDRPIFHGLLGDIEPEQLVSLTTEEKVPYVLRIIGVETISTRLAGSMIEVESTIKTWPQLGSSVVLGGGAAADVARRINLGQMAYSGRFYVDIEELIPDHEAPRAGQHGAPAPAAVRPAPLAPPLPVERMRACAARLRPPPPSAVPLGEEAARALVADAASAPSGGNCQPWRWLLHAGRLLLFHDGSRTTALTDFQGSGSLVALGAAVETLRLSAQARGLPVAITLLPDADEPQLVAAIDALDGPGEGAEPRWGEHLAALIGERRTTRKNPPRGPLAPETAERLDAAVRSVDGASLTLLQGDEALDEIGRLLGAGDRLRILCEPLFRELTSELRWTAAQAAATRDGIDLDCLELSPGDRAAMQMFKRPDVIEFVRSLQGGCGFEKMAHKAIASASAVGLLTVPSAAPADYLRGGQAVQRLWLTATERGVAMHPMTILPYLFARLTRGGGQGLDEPTVAALRALHPRYLRLFPLRDGEAEVLLFRLTSAEASTVRSRRRPVDEIFHTLSCMEAPKVPAMTTRALQAHACAIEVDRDIHDPQALAVLVRALVAYGAHGVLAEGAGERAVGAPARMLSGERLWLPLVGVGAGARWEVEGLTSRFSFELGAGEEHEGGTAWPLPARARQQRRRWLRRAKAPASWALRTRLPSAPAVAVRRRLVDVSLGGLSFAASPDDPVAVGDELAHVEISEGGEVLGLASGWVRHVTDRPGGRVVGVALTFSSTAARLRYAASASRVLHPHTRLGGASPEETFEVYSQSGYLNLSGKTPDEFAHLLAQFTRASERLEQAQHLGFQVYWPSPSGMLITMMQARVYESAWLMFQLGKRPDDGAPGPSNRQVLHEIYNHAIEHMQLDPELRWLVVYAQREGARWTKFFHRDTYAPYVERGLACILPFRAMEAHAALPTPTADERFEVGPATDEELEALVGVLLRSRPAIYRQALDLTPARLLMLRLQGLMAEAGLTRERAIWAARRGGESWAIVVMEDLDDGVHLFDLLDTVRIFPLRDGGMEAERALLSAAFRWYRDRGDQSFMYFQEDESASAARELGLRDLGLADVTILSAKLLPDLLETVHEWTAPVSTP